MKNNLKADIREYYANLMPSPNEEKCDQTIDQARERMHRIDYTDDTTTFLTFFLSQISFIRKRVWFIQFAILLFFASLLIGKQEAVNVLGAMTTIIPLIFLTWTRELSRAFVYETVEVELSTRFSLRQVILSRITIMGLFDLLSLTIFGFWTAHKFSMAAPNIFTFLFVPFLITAAGCLFILNHFPAKYDELCCTGWCVAVMMVTFYLATWEAQIYDAALIIGWDIAFVIALILAIIEFYLLLKKCTQDVCFRSIA